MSFLVLRDIFFSQNYCKTDQSGLCSLGLLGAILVIINVANIFKPNFSFFPLKKSSSLNLDTFPLLWVLALVAVRKFLNL